MPESEKEAEHPNWVVVTKHDKLLAGPFGPDETEKVMEAANREQTDVSIRDVYVITESHFRDIQDRWLPELRYYKRTFGDTTFYVGRTETQFAMVGVGDAESDSKPTIQTNYYYDYSEWRDDKSDLEELDPDEVEELPNEVRESLRGKLMNLEQKAQRMLKSKYERGETPSSGAWNPLVRRRIEESA